MVFTEALKLVMSGKIVYNEIIEISLTHGMLSFRYLDSTWYRPYVPTVEDMKDEGWIIK